MFERLILCEYAVVDLTTADANAYYGLGVRHAARPRTTIPIAAEGTRLPLDPAPVGTVPYRLDAAGNPADVGPTRAAIVDLLREARDPKPDNPVFQLVTCVV